MKITYKSDHELKHKDNILTHLRAYNESHTGERKSDKYNVYVFDKKDLIGAVYTEQGWDWVFITKLYFKDQEVFTILFNELFKYYKGNAEGMMYTSNNPKELKGFISNGFTIKGEYPDMPIGDSTKYLINRELNYKSINSAYSVKTSNETIEDYKDKLESLIPKGPTQIDLSFIAFDEDKFAGGVYGWLKEDYLYVSLLAVVEEYRGNDIATNLMKLIEEEAVNRGIKQFYLGTVSFQAKGFYLKQGYAVNIETHDFPVGFTEYDLIKKYEG